MTIHSHMTGGGFGRRLGVRIDPVFPHAAGAQRAVKLDPVTSCVQPTIRPYRRRFPCIAVTSDNIVVDGIHLPIKRRAYARGQRPRLILDMLMVCIDISDVSFT